MLTEPWDSWCSALQCLIGFSGRKKNFWFRAQQRYVLVTTVIPKSIPFSLCMLHAVQICAELLA